MASTSLSITYAQYNEDLILLALFPDVKKGFYVDIGANYPDIDSVTKLFYERGWRGINVEPIKSLYKLLVQERKRDINLHCGVGLKSGTAEFREYTERPGHSTFEKNTKKEHTELEHKDYLVPIMTNTEILKANNVGHIHFMKIDVEGYEYEVVAGTDWKRYHPEVICIEANHVTKDWRKILGANNYKLFIFDGLNEYYIDKSSWKRTENFGERAASLTYNAIKEHHMKSWRQDIERIKFLENFANRQDALIKSLQKIERELEETTKLSFKDRAYRSRLKLAIKGLTLDFYRFKKSNR